MFMLPPTLHALAQISLGLEIFIFTEYYIMISSEVVFDSEPGNLKR